MLVEPISFIKNLATVKSEERLSVVFSGQPATSRSKVVVVGLTTVAFLTRHTWLTLTHATYVALQILRTSWVTVTALTSLSRVTSVVIITAAFTVDTECVFPAFRTVSTMSSSTVQLLIKVTAIRQTVAVTWLAFVCICCCGSVPWLIVVEWQAFTAVGSRCVVLTLADKPFLEILTSSLDAVASMTIALASSTDNKVRNGIEI
jgi:hypothetical protein